MEDDAGGGRRGTRPALTDGLRAGIEAAWPVALANVRDLGGSANLNLLAQTAGGRKVVVRAYRTHVDRARLDAIQAARTALADGGVPVAPLLPAHDGALAAEVDGHLVEVEEFVDHDAKMDSPGRLDAALPTLGRIHDVLAAHTTDAAGRTAEFANAVELDGIVDAVRRGTDRIRAWRPTQEEAALADAADRLAADLHEHRAVFDGLPRQLVHGDFWDNNVLFRGGEVVLVADLDFMAERYRVDDLALTSYFASFVPVPWQPLADAYDRGTTRPLSSQEREALPLAIARQPLWSFAMWTAQLDDEAAARAHVRSLLG